MKIKKLYLNLPKILETIFTIISENNGECRLIGGCVRDIIINNTPIDFDIATDLDPLKVTKIFMDKGINVIPIGIKYGTVLVQLKNTNFEITTLRKDAQCFGRDAKVTFVKNWKEDAARRDFTINAMSISPDLILYDYFNGEHDLLQKKVKFIGNPNIRIKEDNLRILRYLRFLACFGLKNIDFGSYLAAIKNIGLVELLPRERVKKEVMRLLCSKYAKDVLIELNKKNYFPYIGLSTVIINNRKLEEIELKIGDSLVNLAILLSISKTFNKESFILIKKSLCLSNKELKDIKLLASFNKKEAFSDFHHYKFLHELGNIYYLRLLFVVKNTSTVKRYKQYYAMSQKRVYYNFPIKGEDIRKLMVSRSVIGYILKDAKNEWHKLKNNVSKECIMQYIEKKYLDKNKR